MCDDVPDVLYPGCYVLVVILFLNKKIISIAYGILYELATHTHHACMHMHISLLSPPLRQLLWPPLLLLKYT